MSRLILLKTLANSSKLLAEAILMGKVPFFLELHVVLMPRCFLVNYLVWHCDMSDYITARHDRSDTLNGRGGGILIYGMPFLLPSNNLQQSTNLKTPMTNTNPQKNIPDFNSMKRHRGPLCIANSH